VDVDESSSPRPEQSNDILDEEQLHLSGLFSFFKSLCTT
jgi:hypothetical protein